MMIRITGKTDMMLTQSRNIEQSQTVSNRASEKEKSLSRQPREGHCETWTMDGPWTGSWTISMPYSSEDSTTHACLTTCLMGCACYICSKTWLPWANSALSGEVNGHVPI